jgi:hypothetical protein
MDLNTAGCAVSGKGHGDWRDGPAGFLDEFFGFTAPEILLEQGQEAN